MNSIYKDSMIGASELAVPNGTTGNNQKAMDMDSIETMIDLTWIKRGAQAISLDLLW